ncbi:YadA C-terminal domain-containing protein [uncultured Phascolarctobacterium sp.]|uniref:YadA C-terminal domain-containing protein n=1 Tax=uncultured Phascolarctobacterium sp. TaxID=512296 RepID=UPI00262F3B52|nr:YadA C-terminal domain-containing protein [uncultured Phascolarctobacterium sp.]
MKKNLAKVVTLGLLTASVFVVNGFGQAWAAEIGNGLEIKAGLVSSGGVSDVKANTEAIKSTGALATQKDLVAVNDQAEQAAQDASNAQTTANNAQTIANQAKEDISGLNDKIGNYNDRGEHDVFGDKPININEALDKLAGQAETEAKVREDADIELSNEIKQEAKYREEADKRIEKKFDGEVSRLDSRIDKLDGRVEKVGAMAAAMASLHTMGYDPAAPTEIAVGVGQYRDKTGLALGAFHYPNKNFMLNVSVSTAGDEFMAGIGATWKIGRRSPEAMLKAEQEKAARQALAKAEAEKQAAKDARVAAQAARHAKMLAERGL